jgi:hypothetical protein
MADPTQAASRAIADDSITTVVSDTTIETISDAPKRYEHFRFGRELNKRSSDAPQEPCDLLITDVSMMLNPAIPNRCNTVVRKLLQQQIRR